MQFSKPGQHLGELNLSPYASTQQEVVQPASFVSYSIRQFIHHPFIHSRPPVPGWHCAMSGNVLIPAHMKLSVKETDDQIITMSLFIKFNTC